MDTIRKVNDFEYETLETGQRRCYGDSWYKYRVKDLADPPRDRDAVLAFCKTSVRKAYGRSERPNWSSPTVVSCEQDATRGGDWIYLVKCEYTG